MRILPHPPAVRGVQRSIIEAQNLADSHHAVHGFDGDPRLVPSAIARPMTCPVLRPPPRAAGRVVVRCSRTPQRDRHLPPVNTLLVVSVLATPSGAPKVNSPEAKRS